MFVLHILCFCLSFSNASRTTKAVNKNLWKWHFLLGKRLQFPPTGDKSSNQTFRGLWFSLGPVWVYLHLHVLQYLISLLFTGFSGAKLKVRTILGMLRSDDRAKYVSSRFIARLLSRNVTIALGCVSKASVTLLYKQAKSRSAEQGIRHPGYALELCACKCVFGVEHESACQRTSGLWKIMTVSAYVCVFGARARALKWAVTHAGYSLIQTTGREWRSARQRSAPAASGRVEWTQAHRTHPVHEVASH